MLVLLFCVVISAAVAAEDVAEDRSSSEVHYGYQRHYGYHPHLSVVDPILLPGPLGRHHVHHHVKSHHEGPLGGGHTHHVSHGYHSTDYVAPHPHPPFHLPDHHGHQVKSGYHVKGGYHDVDHSHEVVDHVSHGHGHYTGYVPVYGHGGYYDHGIGYAIGHDAIGPFRQHTGTFGPFGFYANFYHDK